MNLVRLLLGTGKHTVFVAILIGMVSAASNAGLLMLIHAALTWEGLPLSSFTVAFGLLCVAVLISKVISQALLVRLSQSAVYHPCMTLSRRILSAPLRQLESLGAHRFLATLTEDIPVISNALLSVPILCINLALLICCLAYLGYLSIPLLVGIVCFMLLGMASYQLPMIWAERRFARAREEQDSLLFHFRGLIEGFKELTLHTPRREAFLKQALEPAAAGYREQNTVAMTLFTGAASWGQLLFLVVLGLLLLVVPRFYPLDAETLGGATLAVLFMISPIEAVMGSIPFLTQAQVALRKIDSLELSLQAEPAVAMTTVPAPGSLGKQIDLLGVTHAYQRECDGSGFVLGPIHLRLYPGELTFLVGGNGSGKTTLAKLIVGLYAPESGAILLDGEPIEAQDREAYRQHFSAVFADTYVFESLLGQDQTKLQSQAQDLLHRLQLQHKVRIDGGKFSTTRLSQGQRKRLALLTAYLEDRPVYLFDEWAADQDVQFKEVFYTRLLPELKARGKTVVVITHDDRYFDVADRLVKLDNGQLVTESTRTEVCHGWTSNDAHPEEPRPLAFGETLNGSQ